MAKKTPAVEEQKTDEVVQETAAADTLKPHASAAVGKSHLLAQAMQKLSGMKIEDLSHFFNDSIAQIGKEAEKIPDGAAAKNKATINAKEEIEALFAGQDLSEDFLTKATILFESAVEVKVGVIKAELEEQMEADLVEQVQAIHEEVTDKVNDFIVYSAQEFIKENALAIDASLKTEIVEDFIHGLKGLFADNYIEVPDEKLDVVEALSEKVEELEEQLNKTIETNIELSKVVAEQKMTDVVKGLSEGLTMTQVEKFNSLVETVEFDGDVDAYKTKLTVIKEHHFAAKKPSTKMVVENTEEVTGMIDEETTPAKKAPATAEMAAYANIISRTKPIR